MNLLIPVGSIWVKDDNKDYFIKIVEIKEDYIWYDSGHWALGYTTEDVILEFYTRIA